MRRCVLTMKRSFSFAFAVLWLLHVAPLAEAEALGFGAGSKGGAGGQVIEVTRLDDALKEPEPGMLRWAVQQKGPRVVKFRVVGTIELKDTLRITEPFLTLDGEDAPGEGVCVRGGTLEFDDTHDIIVRYLRVRLGDEATKRRNAREGLKRPKGSKGLDCISLSGCRDVLIEHVSASWSCDELFSVVHCQNVTVQWCLLSEPLSNPELHPYGDNHAFCFNSSASTMSIHHCLFARYVMRGPQLEANDMRKGDDYAVQMEAVRNVMFDYQKSGSRYTTGVEDHRDEAAKKGYAFQLIGNVYVAKGDKPKIQAVMKHEVHDGVRAYVSDVAEVQFSDSKGREEQLPKAKAQLQKEPLFITTATQAEETAEQTMQLVLEKAGCSHQRDAVDRRIVADVKGERFGPVVKSQNDVGGWPELK